MEYGVAPTRFEVLSYNEELSRCQRYYQAHTVNNMPMGPNTYYNTGSFYFTYPVPMRDSPSTTYSFTAFRTGDSGGTSVSGSAATRGDRNAMNMEVGSGAWAKVYLGSITASSEL